MAPDKSVTVAELSLNPVDRDSPIPLYFQIENDLRRALNLAGVGPGVLIPTETDLCQAYGVGRHTVRMALARLAADDLIARRAGQGTMIKPQPDRMKFYLNRSFTQQMAAMGRRAHSQVLGLSPGVIEEKCPGIFRDKIGAAYWQLVRLRFGDDEPIALQSTIILAELCPGLEQHDFNQQGLYETLAAKYHLFISQIHHTISATTADQFQAELLKIAEGDPLLVVHTSAFLDNRRAVEHTISYYRADKYQYSTTDTYSG